MVGGGGNQTNLLNINGDAIGASGTTARQGGPLVLNNKAEYPVVLRDLSRDLRAVIAFSCSINSARINGIADRR